MQARFLALLLGLLRQLPAPLRRFLDARAQQAARRRFERRREQALARR